MYTLAVENERGEYLEVTHNEGYEITEVSGLTPPNANINSTAMAGGDGSSFNSASVTNRNIVITLYITSNVEYNRQRLYKYFRVKKSCRIYFKNANRNVYIDGYVETFEATIFDVVQKVQISILCVDPYFKNTSSSLYEFSWTTGAFEFPVSIPESGVIFGSSANLSTVDILNNGEHEVGVQINLYATGTVLNPKILNALTNESFALNLEMEAGDQLVITTHRGNKKVVKIKDGVTTNIMNTVASNPTWFEIGLGDNIFAYEADVGGSFLEVNFTFTEEFLGV